MSFDISLQRPIGFDALYGLEVSEASPQQLIATVTVRDELKQPFGLVHGGVYASIAEGLASFGTVLGVYADGKVAMGISNITSFLRPITAGVIHARVRCAGTQRPHDLGLGGRVQRRRRPSVRALAGDRGRQGRSEPRVRR